MASGPDRVAHVMERAEHGDEIKTGALEVLSSCCLELHTGQSLGMLLRMFD